MARGNSTRRNLAPEDISKLIRGDKTALQANAAKGGNAPAAQPNPTAPAATTPTPVPQNPNVPTTIPLTQAEVDAIKAEFAADEAKEVAFKKYFQNLQDKAEFDSEQAAEAAREAAFKAYVEGQRSLAEAAALASPKNAQKAGLANANKEEKGKKKEKSGKEKAGEKPWYLRSGRGPGSILFGRGKSGNINEISTVGGGAEEFAVEALNNLRKKAGVSKNFLLGKAGPSAPSAPSGPSK